VLYTLFRRVDFRGKARLRPRLPMPVAGERVVRFPGGMRLRLDLREQIQRDFLFGLYDRYELELVRERLRTGGDFVDVGAHIGMYSVAAALALRGRGRVLAFEPNPSARAQLEHNLALNGCDSVTVLPLAVADGAGETLLHVPATADPSFSSLDPARLADEGEPVRVGVTTVDAEVEARGLAPTVVKNDVEGQELDVFAGMSRALAGEPAFLVEVSPESASELDRRLAAYDALRMPADPISLMWSWSAA